MRYIIPINSTTQPVLAELNGGVKPEIECHTYFIYDSDPDGHNDIVSDQSVWAPGGHAERAYDTFRVMPVTQG